MKAIRAVSFLLAAGAAMAQLPPPHPAFTPDAVHVIRLRFENANWYEVLTANYSGVEADNPYFAASLEWGSYKFDQVGVRFKGNNSYNVNSKKKPFRIKLNEFVKGQKIEGLASFNLSNANGDASFVREGSYYELANSLGLFAPRSNFAALYINDTYWGLYVLGEVVNSDFLKYHLGKNDDTGNLYKANLGASFAYLGEDKAAYKQYWEKQTNEEADDWSDLIALCKLINDTPASELRAKLEPIMDVDSVLAALALDNATVNLDSYVGMLQNFNIYKRPSDGRWVWIPWDPSLAFGAFSGGVTDTSLQQISLQWTAANGMGAGGGGTRPGAPTGGPTTSSSGPVLATKLWSVPEYKDRYNQIYQQIVDRVFLAGPLVARMNTLRAMIRPYVEQDTQKLVTMEQFENAMNDASSATSTTGPGGQRGGGPTGGAPGLEPFITGRIASIKSQLAANSIPVMGITTGKTSLSFNMAAGGSAADQTVEVKLNGSSTPAWFSLSTSTASNSNWLVVSPAGGVVDGSFTVSVSASKLDPGTYTGSIVVHSMGANNSPLTIPVTLTVTK